MARTKAFAPAKLNLTLHVTGQRADGYHLLDSLVAFADIGDWITISDAPNLALTVTGPRGAGVPTGADNLVLKAARFMGVERAHIHLEKHLPAAAGIGGGSADAAATLRACALHFGMEVPGGAESLGADVPVCLQAGLVRMRGVGEQLEQLPLMPEIWVVLVNPGVDVPTPAVFKALKSKTNPAMQASLPRFATGQGLVDFLTLQRNDLEAPARAQAPVISDVLERIAKTSGCLLARMSGSGATCFGLFSDAASAARASQDIRHSRSGWWVVDAPLRAGNS